MSRSLVSCVLAAAALIGVQAQNVEAATIYRAVGSCVTNPVVPPARHYNTIQEAVNASIASTNPAIIMVCPGNYPEQVSIGYGVNPDYEPVITIKSATTTNAVITAPDAGLVAKFHSDLYGWVAPQIFVRDTRGVTIQNIDVDGRHASGAPLTAADCPIGQDGNPAAIAGIMFFDAGDPAYSFVEAGTIKFVNIHDEPAFGTCGANSHGVLSDNSFIKIDDNTITNVYTNGIGIFNGNAEVRRNKISHIAATGIRVTGGHPYDVSLNNVWWVQNGIVLEAGANNVTVDKNQFTPIPTSDYGVYLDHATNNAIVNNFIDGEDHVNNNWGGVFVGIALNAGAAGNKVEGNKITHCKFACIMDSNTGATGANTIDWNDFVESHFFGIWSFNSDGDLPNVYSNLDVNHDIPTPMCITLTSDTQCIQLTGDENYFLH
jgi:hypothetical protein